MLPPRLKCDPESPDHFEPWLHAVGQIVATWPSEPHEGRDRVLGALAALGAVLVAAINIWHDLGGTAAPEEVPQAGGPRWPAPTLQALEALDGQARSLYADLTAGTGVAVADPDPVGIDWARGQWDATRRPAQSIRSTIRRLEQRLTVVRLLQDEIRPGG